MIQLLFQASAYDIIENHITFDKIIQTADKIRTIDVFEVTFAPEISMIQSVKSCTE